MAEVEATADRTAVVMNSLPLPILYPAGACEMRFPLSLSANNSFSTLFSSSEALSGGQGGPVSSRKGGGGGGGNRPRLFAYHGVGFT